MMDGWGVGPRSSFGTLLLVLSSACGALLSTDEDENQVEAPPIAPPEDGAAEVSTASGETLAPVDPTVGEPDDASVPWDAEPPDGGVKLYTTCGACNDGFTFNARACLCL